MVSVTLTNNTDRSQAFEFGLPPGCDVAFIPNVGEIPAKSNLRVQVEFSPKPEAGDEDLPGAGAGDALTDALQEADQQQSLGANKDLSRVVEVRSDAYKRRSE